MLVNFEMTQEQQASQQSLPQKSECLKIGKIVGFHGLKGDAKVRPSDPNADWSDSLKQIFVFDAKTGQAKRLEICNSKHNGPHVLLRFNGYADRTQAEPLMGLELYALATDLPKPDGDQYYASDLIGLDVYIPEMAEPLGVVNDIVSSTGSDFLEIRVTASNEMILVPFLAHFFPLVDLAEKRITLDMPPGFIETETNA